MKEKIKVQRGVKWCERAFVLSALGRIAPAEQKRFRGPKIKTAFFAILPWAQASAIGSKLVGGAGESKACPGSDTSVEPQNLSIFASFAPKTSWPKRHSASCRCFCEP
jgi:hypothetical protein